MAGCTHYRSGCVPIASSKLLAIGTEGLVTQKTHLTWHFDHEIGVHVQSNASL